MTFPVLLLLASLAPLQDAPVTVPPAPTEEAAPSASSAPARATTSAATASDTIQAGLVAYKKRRFKQAETEFRRAVEADPQSAAAHFYLGYSIYKQAEPRRPNHPGKQQAAQEFAKAYELDPGFKPDWRPRS